MNLDIEAKENNETGKCVLCHQSLVDPVMDSQRREEILKDFGNHVGEMMCRICSRFSFHDAYRLSPQEWMPVVTEGFSRLLATLSDPTGWGQMFDEEEDDD